jgi:hypothetical protein
VTGINQPKKVSTRDDMLGAAPSARAKRVRLVAKLLDNAITIPGTGWKIGLDPIVGLIPGIGDLITAVMSGYIILEAARANASPLTLARMVTNVGIDTLVGAIPALGDVFDAAWKSNTKNVALLERHLATSQSVETEQRRGNMGATVLILVVLAVLLGAGLVLGIYVARLLWGAVTR